VVCVEKTFASFKPVSLYIDPISPDIRRELQDKRTWDLKIVTMFPEIPVKIPVGPLQPGNRL
jgi:hypothetical protein